MKLYLIEKELDSLFVLIFNIMYILCLFIGEAETRNSLPARTLISPLPKTPESSPKKKVIYVNSSKPEDYVAPGTAYAGPLMAQRQMSAGQQSQRQEVLLARRNLPAVTITPVREDQQLDRSRGPSGEDYRPPFRQRHQSLPSELTRNSSYNHLSSSRSDQYSYERGASAYPPQSGFFQPTAGQSWQEWQPQRTIEARGYIDETRPPRLGVEALGAGVREGAHNSRVMYIPEPPTTGRIHPDDRADPLQGLPRVGCPQVRSYSGDPKDIQLPNFVNESAAQLYNRRYEEVSHIVL